MAARKAVPSKVSANGAARRPPAKAKADVFAELEQEVKSEKKGPGSRSAAAQPKQSGAPKTDIDAVLAAKRKPAQNGAPSSQPALNNTDYEKLLEEKARIEARQAERKGGSQPAAPPPATRPAGQQPPAQPAARPVVQPVAAAGVGAGTAAASRPAASAVSGASGGAGRQPSQVPAGPAATAIPGPSTVSVPAASGVRTSGGASGASAGTSAVAAQPGSQPRPASAISAQLPPQQQVLAQPRPVAGSSQPALASGPSPQPTPSPPAAQPRGSPPASLAPQPRVSPPASLAPQPRVSPPASIDRTASPAAGAGAGAAGSSPSSSAPAIGIVRSPPSESHQGQLLTAAQAKAALPKGPEVDEEQEYEEDFDKYEDDFDDPPADDAKEAKQSVPALAPRAAPSGAELEAARRQMEEENRQLQAQRERERQQVQQRAEAEVKARAAPTRQEPAYSSHQVALPKSKADRQTEANRKYQHTRWLRAKELIPRIRLTVEDYHVFDLPAVAPADQLTLEITQGLKRTIGIQWNDDGVNQEVQTEEPDLSTTGTQFPEEKPPSLADTARLAKRLQRFVQSAGQLMESMLSEDLDLTSGGLAATESKAPAGADSIATQSVALACPALFGRRRVQDIAFSEVVLVAFSKVLDAGESKQPGFSWLANKGLLILWDVLQSEQPLKILCCDGQPMSCSLSPNKAHIAFAGDCYCSRLSPVPPGLEEGSVALWDLREPSSMHRSVGSSGESYVVRTATFTTDDFRENHLAPVRRLVPLPMPSQESGAFDVMSVSASAASKTSFQVASLDDDGAVFIWTVIELKEAEMSGSDTDLGLNIGGRIKLIRSSENAKSSSSSAFDLRFKRDDTNEFLVALGGGSVIRTRRYGEKPVPSAYRLDGFSVGERKGKHVESGVAADAARCLSISPFLSNYFLAGFETGTISLFDMDTAVPIASWPHFCDGQVAGVEWSPLRPSVFFALDAKGTLTIWDLLKSDQRPVATAKLAVDGDRPLFAVSHAVVGARVSMLASPGKSAGAVDVLQLKSFVSEGNAKEKDQLADFLRHVH